MHQLLFFTHLKFRSWTGSPKRRSDFLPCVLPFYPEHEKLGENMAYPTRSSSIDPITLYSSLGSSPLAHPLDPGSGGQQELLTFQGCPRNSPKQPLKNETPGDITNALAASWLRAQKKLLFVDLARETALTSTKLQRTNRFKGAMKHSLQRCKTL